jgi:hypothetical protein
MSKPVRLTVDSVLGPIGLSTDDLPAPDVKRWSMVRKAAVVAAVRAGLMSFEEACIRYRLHADEFLSWQQHVRRHGLKGLRSTRTQLYSAGGAKRRTRRRSRHR